MDKIFFTYRQKLRSMQQLHELNDCLINAHLQPQQLTKALQLISDISRGDTVFILLPACKQQPPLPIICSSNPMQEQRLQLLLTRIATSEQALSSVCGIPDMHIQLLHNEETNADALLGWNGILTPLQKDSICRSFSGFCRNYLSHRHYLWLAYTDMLTGLPNRSCFDAERRSLQHKNAYWLSCIYLDVNGLHQLNNSRGHAAGDKLLRNLAAQLAQNFGREHAYRVGGDEFVILLPNHRPVQAKQQADMLQKILLQQGCSVSAGIAGSFGSIPNLAEMLLQAEQNMLKKKIRLYRSRRRA